MRYSLVAWKDVDVDNSQGVCLYVDNDVHTKQGHAQLDSELSHKGSQGLRAGRWQARHLLIQCCEIRAGLWFGHLMAVEEYGLSVTGSRGKVLE